jgi:aminoglycoside phosphotransferase (APT) family kinase protein
VAKPPQLEPAAVGAILRKFDPELRFVHCSELTGGIAAGITGIEAERPGGQSERLVLRQYGSVDVAANPRIATTEYRLLESLHRAGLPVPKPYLADESGMILPGPCLLVEFADGTPVIAAPAPAGFTRQLAAILAGVHRSGITPAEIGFLPDMRDAASRRLARRLQARPDETLSEPAIRAALTANPPPAQVNRSVLLHGDFWPGNTLWLDGQLTAVIDWENAAFGDPLADLGNARMEMAMLFGVGAEEDLTTKYRTQMPGLDVSALPYWDLLAALRPAGTVTDWGLEPGELARVRAGHRRFAEAALQQL